MNYVYIVAGSKLGTVMLKLACEVDTNLKQVDQWVP